MPEDEKPTEAKTERFNMFISPSESAAIDEWSFSKRIRSKSEAVRRLCQIGLAYDAEVGSSREQVRLAIKQTASGLEAMMALSHDAYGELAYDIARAMGSFLAGGRAMIELYQDMAVTDGTASTMEEVGEFSALLDKVAALRAEIEAQRKR